MSIEEKSVCSEAKRLANRENAKKSTGPKSVEGKNRSRLNAMTHGFCATTVEMPGEDPEAIVERELEWQAELNPEARAVQGYLIHSVVRQTMKLDRIHESFQATASKRVRDAHKVDHERKMREIDGLKDMLITGQCAIAVRRLMTTLEGCEYLIHEWTSLRPTLELTYDFGTAPWDDVDLARLKQLTSNESSVRGLAPTIYVLPSIAIRAHRDVVIRMKQNEHPEKLPSNLRYNTYSDRVRDEQDLPGLYEKAEVARLWLIKVFDDHLAILTDLKRKLEAEAVKHHDDLETMAWFDASDEGKLMHRYEHETHRAVFRGVKEIQTLNRNESKSAQVVSDYPFTSDDTPASPRPQTPRNEATATGRTNPFPPASDVSKGDFTFMPVNITSDPGVKKKQ